MLSLKDAARHFSLTIRRLLALGADSRLMVLAPVLNAGIYEWPVGQAGIAFPALPHPLQRRFGPSDRVVLSPATLREIEGQGWSDVRSFVAVHEAREVLREAEFGFTLSQKRFEVRTAPSLGKVGWVVERVVTEEEYEVLEPQLEDLALASPWSPVEGVSDFPCARR